MKELFETIINTYNNYRGTGKVLALFLVSVLIIYMVNVCRQKDGEATSVINPLLFILCPLAGIGYAFTLACGEYMERVRKHNDVDHVIFKRVLIALLIIMTLTLSGRFVFMAISIDRALPFMLIPVYIAIYVLLAGRLFENRGLKWFMVLCICVLNLWGYQSEALIPVTMLSGRITLPSVIVNGILPLVLWVAVGKYSEYMKQASLTDAGNMEELDYYEWEEEDMKNHKIINSRNLAIALLVVVIMLAGSVFIMNRKINNLYETTVNLQNQVNELQND